MANHFTSFTPPDEVGLALAARDVGGFLVIIRKAWLYTVESKVGKGRTNEAAD